MLKLYDLKTEYRANPIGLDVSRPAFSWKLHSDKRGVLQRSCRLTVWDGDRCVWDSGTLETGASLCHIYAGEALKRRTEYRVTVEVSDNHGETAAIDGSFETGLLDYTTMKADWITHAFEDGLEPCAVFEKSFPIAKPLAPSAGTDL